MTVKDFFLEWILFKEGMFINMANEKSSIPGKKIHRMIFQDFVDSFLAIQENDGPFVYFFKAGRVFD